MLAQYYVLQYKITYTGVGHEGEREGRQSRAPFF